MAAEQEARLATSGFADRSRFSWFVSDYRKDCGSGVRGGGPTGFIALWRGKGVWIRWRRDNASNGRIIDIWRCLGVGIICDGKRGRKNTAGDIKVGYHR